MMHQKMAFGFVSPGGQCTSRRSLEPRLTLKAGKHQHGAPIGTTPISKLIGGQLKNGVGVPFPLPSPPKDPAHE